MRIKKIGTRMDDNLLSEIGRRNLILLLGLSIGSLFWQSIPVTLGVLGGSVVSVGGYYWLHQSLKGLLIDPQDGSAFRFKVRYMLRLAALAALLVILIVVVRVNPVALSIGLSVVVVNLMWTTFSRVTK